jgi:hypothetical protein
LKRGPWNFDFIFDTKRHNLEKRLFGAIESKEVNSDEFKSGELLEKLAVATSNLATISAYA